MNFGAIHNHEQAIFFNIKKLKSQLFLTFCFCWFFDSFGSFLTKNNKNRALRYMVFVYVYVLRSWQTRERLAIWNSFWRILFLRLEIFGGKLIEVSIIFYFHSFYVFWWSRIFAHLRSSYFYSRHSNRISSTFFASG